MTQNLERSFTIRDAARVISQNPIAFYTEEGLPVFESKLNADQAVDEELGLLIRSGLHAPGGVAPELAALIVCKLQERGIVR